METGRWESRGKAEEESRHRQMQEKPPGELIGNQAMLNRTGIPDALKEKVEQKSGISMDGVQVHYNSPKPAAVQAFAYTQGNQVYLGPGQEKHLGHELGHVVQQLQGRVKPTGTVNGLPLNDDASLEQEADDYR